MITEQIVLTSLLLLSIPFLVIMYNTKVLNELSDERLRLLANLKNCNNIVISMAIIERIEKIDMILFGGCKQKNKRVSCYECNITECPKNPVNKSRYV